MKRLMVLMAVVFLFLGGIAHAAGTATLTVEWTSVSAGAGIPAAAELKWVCTGNATGDLTSPTVTTTSTTDILLNQIFKVARRIDRILIDPTGGGGTAPANLFDIELRLSSTFANDLLGGLGDNCGNTTIIMDAPVTETNSYPVHLRETPVIFGDNLGATRTFAIWILLTATD